MPTLEGTLAFEHLKEFEVYKGKCTEKYSITLALDPITAEHLKSKGVKIREYKGTPQRKFTSKFNVPVYDSDGHPYHFSGSIGRGATVKILYKLSDKLDDNSVVPYMSKIKVLKEAELSEDDGDF